ncbi:MAG: exodeoxyribonuclease VII large subunit [Firmicutes bacterium]|nr:exodeoxyribonuclease VII large subunit [Bacillota bacterium]
MQELTVLELTRYLKNIMESDHILANLWVKGEVSNFKRASSGHLYLTLKDTSSCIRVVMFRSRARRLRFDPEDGMSVRVRGYITIFERDGQYQLYAEEMEPVGSGAMFAALENLKKKLSAEGLFDPNRKKKPPRYPACVGIITSATGAAVRDMLNILHRRWPPLRIMLAPVKVQGESAPDELANALNMLNKLPDIDIIIIGRGGGSIEDLWAFNTEKVARGIAGSVIPVISAVGHETDFTISDMVADMRAPTPSAAAEMAVPDCRELTRTVHLYRQRMTRCIRQQVSTYLRRLDFCARNRVLARPVSALCDQRRQVLDLLDKQLRKAALDSIRTPANRLSLLTGRLNALSPLSTLTRGYSFTTLPDGTVVKDSSQVNPGEVVTVHLYRGILSCRVEDAT